MCVKFLPKNKKSMRQRLIKTYENIKEALKNNKRINYTYIELVLMKKLVYL